MMKIIIALIFTLSTMQTFAQVDIKQSENETGQTINPVPYRLFQTQNMWIFIKLDTRNGLMWLVQFGLEGESRVVTFLNSEFLVTTDKEVNDRFTLYPTQNFYTFILLDQLDGRTWQAQWSIDPKERVIIPIE